MLRIKFIFSTAILVSGCYMSFANPQMNENKDAFEKADSTGKWKEVLFDKGTIGCNWRDNWFLDGKISSVSNRKDGMQLTSGPQYGNNSHHMVLWTKKVFNGDLKIDYEYTRLDFENRCVCIIYIQASGSGKGPYDKDISKWNKLREEPAMSQYFNHMNTYHVSYAAFPNKDRENEDYVRARRYVPEKNGLRGTDLKPDYFNTGLFAPGIPHKISIIKKGNDIFMRVSNSKKTCYFHWHNDKLPPIKSGRIGLRQMFTRSMRVKNIRISQPEKIKK